MNLRRMLATVGTAVALLLAIAWPAAAHTPIVLDESDQNPYVAPLALDGTDECVFFGTLPKSGSVRSYQMNLLAGQPLNITLAVANLAPENTTPQNKMPYVVLIAPNGSVSRIYADQRTAVHNTDFNVDLLILRRYAATAMSGTYSVIVVGRAPARFVTGIGVESDVFHGLLRGQVATQAQVDQWYAKKP
jgi:hypothetical protein